MTQGTTVPTRKSPTKKTKAPTGKTVETSGNFTVEAPKDERRRASGGRSAAEEPARPRPGADTPAQSEEAAEAAMGLDMLLVDAARGPLRRMVPPAGTTLRFGSALVRQPGTVAKRATEFVKELAAIAAGRSELEPGRKD